MDSTYTFQLITTHRANLTLTLVDTRDTTRKEVLYQAENDGLREIPWRGLLRSGARADSAIYELRAEGDLPGTLGEGERTETNEWKLLWAGDLDGDRKLDLYVQVSWHYNIVQHKLFLSSRAGAKRLVREVAEFNISGC